MDNSEEKFFEYLAKSGGASNMEEYEAQLAKAANTPVKEKPSARHSEDSLQPEGQLTIDVYQTPSDIVVESAIAGVDPEDLDVEVSSDSVSIRGQRQREHEVSDEDYFYQECYWGRFARSVILPQEIDPENASVSFKNGILKIRLPKLNRRKTKKLQVRFE